MNKADMVTNQQLMRIYGALMWSLGKVVATPETLRVYGKERKAGGGERVVLRGR